MTSRTLQGRRRAWAWLGAAMVLVLLVALVGWPQPRRASADGVPPGGTLRVAMLDPAYQGFDPTADYTSAQFAVARLLQRTLLTHSGVPGYEGTRLVPDLATVLPTISADGLTWTFHIRSGVHYAPPLQDVEVTAQDFVRALERVRTGPPAVAHASPLNYGPGAEYLPGLLDGFQEFSSGKSSSISGAVALDAHTLQLRTTHPDRSLGQLLTLPFAAPIPPSPRPDSPLGIATGHDFASSDDSHEGAGPVKDGFGPYQSATGPYMIEGADRIDYSLATDQQQPPAGFTPSWWFSNAQGESPDVGRLVLVRNPSWQAASDPVRPAYPDRIEISIQPTVDPYAGGLQAGTVDAVIGNAPSADQLESVTGSSRSRITPIDGNGTDWVMLNLVQPPFDDVHVRRAFALALDRDALTRAWAASSGSVSQARATSTIVPGALVAGILGAGSTLANQPVAEARAEMQRSRYWGPGGCIGAACEPVMIGAGRAYDPAVQSVLTAALHRIGLRAKFLPTCGDREWQRDPKGCDAKNSAFWACSGMLAPVALCTWGWTYDYPGAEAMFPPFDVSAAGGSSTTGLGLTPAQVRGAGFRARAIPSVRDDVARCAAALPTQAVPCWARLDQWLTDKVVAVVPFAALQSVRMYGKNVTSAAMDQATGEYSLDRMSLGHS